MSLHKLPLELLQEIVQYLGPAFFREDVGRLTLYRAWYAAARPVYWQEVSFCHHQLQRFWSDANLERRLADIKRHTRHLVLIIGCTRITDPEPQVVTEQEIEDAMTKGLFKKLLQLARRNYNTSTPTPEAAAADDRLTAYIRKRRLIQDEQWKNRSRLNTEIINLARALQGSKHLESLCFNSTATTRAFPMICPVLDFATIKSHLEPANTLTALELRLDYRSEDDASAHICPMISRHLRTLRSLRLHLSRICPDALELAESTLQNIPLQELIVRLDTGFESQRTRDAVPVSGCSRSFVGHQLNEAIVAKVKQLVPLMKRAEVACVLSAEGPIGHHGFYLTLYDALEDKYTEVTSVWMTGIYETAEAALAKNRIALTDG